MDKKLKEYMDKNHYDMCGKENIKRALSLMDKDLKDNDIFLIGENHGVKSNIELKTMFLKYFKEKTNFKYYICELPYSMTYFLNKYLETGNLNILKDIYKPIAGTYAWNRDEYNFWKFLYEYNKGFPKEDRIILLGIDIEHQSENAFRFMEYSLENDYHSKFKYVKDNLLNMAEVVNSNNYSGTRDGKMYENFLDVSKTLGKAKYFGQLGLSHAFQRGMPYVDSFASLLNKEGSPFKGQVISLVYVYEKCKFFNPTKDRNYVSDISTLDWSMADFQRYIKSKHTLIKLNQKNSPFKEDLIWPFEHKFPEEGVTTDYFQYMIIVNESEEMEAF